MAEVQGVIPTPDEARQIAEMMRRAAVVRMRGQQGHAAMTDEVRPYEVRILNSSGGVVPRFGVLGISDCEPSQDSDLDGFQDVPIFEGTTPTAAYLGNFVVCLERIENGSTGLALMVGVVPVKMDCGNASHTHANVCSSVEKLATGYTGARIVYKPSGTWTGKWGLVCLPSVGTNPFYAKAQATWTNSGYSTGRGKVSVKLCDKDGNNVTGDAFYVELYAHNGGDPNVHTGEVLLVKIMKDGGFAAVSDGAKIGSIELNSEVKPGYRLCNGTKSPDMGGRVPVGFITGGIAVGAGGKLGSLGMDGDYDAFGDTGGKTFHGQTENGHPDHWDHAHLLEMVGTGLGDLVAASQRHIHEDNSGTGHTHTISTDSSGDNHTGSTGATAVSLGVPTGDDPAGERIPGGTALPRDSNYNALLEFRHGGGDDGLNTWPSALGATQESHAKADTDNRQPWFVVKFIIRVAPADEP